MVAPKREQEKNYLDSETIIMIMFCKLVEIYLLFYYSYFPICFATIFYFCCSPSKQIATAAILMVSAGYNIMTIPLFCHGSHGYTRANFFWPV